MLLAIAVALGNKNLLLCLALAVTRGRLVPCHVLQKILWPNAMYTFSLSVLLTFLYCIKIGFVIARVLWEFLSVTVSSQWFLFSEVFPKQPV